MTDIVLSSVVPADLSGPLGTQLLALNNAHAQELSWLEPERLRAMVDAAFLAKRIGVDAFLLAFDQDAAYDSPNFHWFRVRYPRFVYVDRVVVAEAARGQGLARRLYGDLFTQAARAGHTYVVCEINADPPNPASEVFHTAQGFAVVGTARLTHVEKTVRYYARELAPA